jgi:hypothetical protein
MVSIQSIAPSVVVPLIQDECYNTDTYYNVDQNGGSSVSSGMFPAGVYELVGSTTGNCSFITIFGNVVSTNPQTTPFALAARVYVPSTVPANSQSYTIGIRDASWNYNVALGIRQQLAGGNWWVVYGGTEVDTGVAIPIGQWVTLAIVADGTNVNFLVNWVNVHQELQSAFPNNNYIRMWGWVAGGTSNLTVDYDKFLIATTLPT